MAKPIDESEAPDYSVPALEKALDILELLASRREGLTQNQIASTVGRSASQIFRSLAALEARGYIHRERPAGLYYLSMRLFELAHQHPPTRGLVQISVPIMRAFAEKIRQSCNLGVWDLGRMIIVAEAESPAPFGFRVRVGGSFAMLGAASGRALLAFQDEQVLKEWLTLSDAAGMTDAERKTYLARFEPIRQQGYEQTQDGLHPGVTDLAFPIRDANDHAVAVLTVPYVATTYSELPLQTVIDNGLDASAEISRALKG